MTVPDAGNPSKSAGGGQAPEECVSIIMYGMSIIIMYEMSVIIMYEMSVII